jgi:hypothetical protein
MLVLKRKWLIALAGALAVVVVGAGAVMAQEGSSGGSTSFLDRVAEKLGVERAELDQAIDEARSDELDEAVADGDITQEQADKLRRRFESGSGDDAPFLLPRRHGQPDGDGDGFRFDFQLPDGEDESFRFGLPFGPGLGNLDDEFAEFLGITTEELHDELRADDATIASVAEAHGKSRDEVKAFAVAKVEEKLDEAVANGDLPQAVADMILSGADMAIDAAIDAPIGSIWGKFERLRERADETPEGDEAPEQRGETQDPDRL